MYQFRSQAKATTLGEIASALAVRSQEATLVAELKAGSEEAYAWLVAQYHQPVYSLVYRMVNDPADAADTTQEVFLKVFRGMKRFNGESSLKTWIYRIALHEASNRRRWWFRHKFRETSMEPPEQDNSLAPLASREIREALVDGRESPFDSAMHEEVREHIEAELGNVPEPFRTTVILRDLEELSYEEIAEVTETSLGTVKSRLTRGREALRKRLEQYIRKVGPALGLDVAPAPNEPRRPRQERWTHGNPEQAEVV
jgi:RNA polymerase sigma-70 factor, ECF subfamily